MRLKERIANSDTIYVAGIDQSSWVIGLLDSLDAFTKFRIWMFLGWQDIKQRYRRSVLGPLWLTLSTGIMIFAMSLLYGQLFNMPMDIYSPFLSSGIIVWTFISTLMNDACYTFLSADSLIKQARLPLLLHSCRMVWRNIVILIHNIVILIPIWIYFSKNVSILDIVICIIGIIFIALNGIWIGVVLGALCARFRDISQIVASLVQVTFFVTPVMWLPSILEGRGVAEWFILLNPFYHFIEIVRAPLLGEDIRMLSWYIVIGMTLFGYICALYLLGRYRKRIPYWL